MYLLGAMAVDYRERGDHTMIRRTLTSHFNYVIVLYMEVIGGPRANQAIDSLADAESASMERYKLAIKTFPSESARRLFLSIIDQKRRHCDRLVELTGAKKPDGNSKIVPRVAGDFFNTDITSEKLAIFLGYCVENEDRMKAAYERVSHLIKRQDDKYIIDGFAADERKIIVWLTDFRDLLALG
jgi:rubrerythrin